MYAALKVVRCDVCGVPYQEGERLAGLEQRLVVVVFELLLQHDVVLVDGRGSSPVLYVLPVHLENRDAERGALGNTIFSEIFFSYDNPCVISNMWVKSV